MKFNKNLIIATVAALVLAGALKFSIAQSPSTKPVPATCERFELQCVQAVGKKTVSIYYDVVNGATVYVFGKAIAVIPAESPIVITNVCPPPIVKCCPKHNKCDDHGDQD